METKFQFTKLSIDEFEKYISELRVGRTIIYVQQHHTYSPSYIHFRGNNHFDLQKGMKNHHVVHNGWNDIGQHYTTFPDGTIMTGRGLEKSPACTYGNNANSICIENLGNFDRNGDSMTVEQKESIIRITAAICRKFNIKISTDRIVYHHWFDLRSGQRNNGTKNNKSCPGTNFFGGNKVSACEDHFLPLITEYSKIERETSVKNNLDKNVCVTSTTLNIRSGPASSFNKIPERAALQLGAILRVFSTKAGWHKISSSQEHWVNSKFTTEVKCQTVIPSSLNIRSGPSESFPRVGALLKDQQVFTILEKGGWFKISMDEKWVKAAYLKIT